MVIQTAKGQIVKILGPTTVIKYVEFLVQTQRGLKRIKIKEGGFAQVTNVKKPTVKKKKKTSRTRL